MILWLASYPRSGNTLLRTILHQCLGRISYTRYQQPSLQSMPEYREIIGSRRFEGDWAQFYAQASASPELIPVKTHEPPCDRQPALYVVRDGRAASLSYYEFLRVQFPAARRSLEQIVCGDDPYGDWTEHYLEWRSAPGPVLTLKFEELVDCMPATLERVASFIGHQGAILPWRNPRARLEQLIPDHVRQGNPVWQPRQPWNERIDRLFLVHHGELMQHLGYYGAGELTRLRGDSPVPARQLDGFKRPRRGLMRRVLRYLKFSPRLLVLRQFLKRVLLNRR